MVGCLLLWLFLIVNCCLFCLCPLFIVVFCVLCFVCFAGFDRVVCNSYISFYSFSGCFITISLVET